MLFLFLGDVGIDRSTLLGSPRAGPENAFAIGGGDGVGFVEVVDAVGMEVGNALGFEASIEFDGDNFTEIGRPGGAFMLVSHVGPAGAFDVSRRGMAGESAGGQNGDFSISEATLDDAPEVRF